MDRGRKVRSRTHLLMPETGRRRTAALFALAAVCVFSLVMLTFGGGNPSSLRGADSGESVDRGTAAIGEEVRKNAILLPGEKPSISWWPGHEGGSSACWTRHGVRDVLRCLASTETSEGKPRGAGLAVVGDQAPPHAAERLAVLVPFTKWDADVLLTRFSEWSQPQMFPCLCRGSSEQRSESASNCQGACDRPVDLILYFHRDLDALPVLRDKVVDTLANTHAIQQCFAEWFVLNANLSEIDDQFRADGTGGPNLQFYRFFGSAAVGRRYDFVLLLEPDVHPIRSGWLSAFCSDTRRYAPFWIRGPALHALTSPADELKKLERSDERGKSSKTEGGKRWLKNGESQISSMMPEPTHAGSALPSTRPATARSAKDYAFGANSIYRPGDECFRAFVQNAEAVEPDLPFWSALAAYRQAPDHFALYSRTASMFQNSDFTWDLAHEEFSGRAIRQQSPVTFLVHGDRDTDRPILQRRPGGEIERANKGIGALDTPKSIDADRATKTALNV